MIQVVNRAVDIIEYVAHDSSRPKLLGEIAADLSLNAGTCANIVKTLLARGYLEKNSGGKGYILGRNLYSIVEVSGNYRELIKAADAEMELITDTLTENSILAILRGEERVIIHKKNAEQFVQAHTANEKKAYDTSSGRLLISMQSDPALDSYIKKHGLPSPVIWKEASTKKRFMEIVEEIRGRGYVLTEDSERLTGVAFPIYKKDRLVAALSIYMPSFRCNEKLLKMLIETGARSAKKISANLSQ
ncbi:MAG TPA: IclR family transcriptional regulator C-terminal domain-containing protein [Chitinophagaceae bacterium]|nr:IclR family transcriptional regulator C-terminal domain-containing protein [Chitinophagaceae bacterium]